MALISDLEFKDAKRKIENSATPEELKGVIETASPHVVTTVLMQRKFAQAIFGKDAFMFLVLRASPLVDPVPVGGLPAAVNELPGTAFLLAYFILSGGWSSGLHMNILSQCLEVLINVDPTTLSKPFKGVYVNEFFHIPPVDSATLFDLDKSIVDLLEDTFMMSPVHGAIGEAVARVTGGVLDDDDTPSTAEDSESGGNIVVKAMNDLEKDFKELIRKYSTNPKEGDDAVVKMIAMGPINYVFIDANLLGIVLQYTKTSTAVEVVVQCGAVVTPEQVDVLLARKKNLDPRTYDRIVWFIAAALLMNKTTNANIELTFTKTIGSVFDKADFTKMVFRYVLQRPGRFEAQKHTGTIRDMVNYARHLTDGVRKKLTGVFKSTSWVTEKNLLKDIIDQDDDSVKRARSTSRNAATGVNSGLVDALYYNRAPKPQKDNDVMPIKVPTQGTVINSFSKSLRKEIPKATAKRNPKSHRNPPAKKSSRRSYYS